ncbi:PE-PPE domain-containing protein [Mycobacterium sp. 21AC1]|uniref:PE-PPE domain-containing protein n=1 Tax=[Mycobacterium] appelbergii TaxID=2939269 RepID=UPI0029393C38|nr:PE-PPE domain-containing protein [Mycobacterium sp. 21AC1]MDV3125088.1 PE-PPE domain-containing protein [Mycobacterium sp. 21AC1]
MRFSPRSAARSVLVAAVAVSGSIAISMSPTFTAAVGLVVATTPLIVPGTGTPIPQDDENYMENAVAYYVAPGGTCGTDGCTNPVAVPYIAQFWPFPFPGWGGLDGAKWNVSVQSGVTRLTGELVGTNNPSADHPVIVFGYSQGATVSSIVKRNLADLPDEQKQYLSFVLIGNPNRPNGGLFERLAILGTVPILDATFGQPTPTDTDIDTVDIALQYDGVSDAPSWVLNPLALANALAGFEYVHGTYLAPDDGEPVTSTPYGYTPEQVKAAVEQATESCTAATHCQVHGDTTYVTLPAKYLPIMQPLLDLGAATGTSALVIPVVDLVSPLTQTLIETGYDRADYGTPTPFRLIPKINPVKLASDLINDIPEGIKAAREPGLAPLPGWTDPTESADTAPEPDVEDLTTKTLAAPSNTKALAVKPDRKPLIRLSPIAKPKTGLTLPGGDDDTDAPQRPSLQKALGIKNHPVRDFAKSVGTSVRKVLRQDRDDAKSKESAPAA